MSSCSLYWFLLNKSIVHSINLNQFGWLVLAQVTHSHNKLKGLKKFNLQSTGLITLQVFNLLILLLLRAKNNSKEQ